jgi:RNA polymerase sigma factor (sigma-70 family)
MDPHELAAGASVDDVASALTDRIDAGSQLQDAIRLLTEDQRAVILLRIVADMSVEDTAAIVGKRPGAVKTLQRRALASLRRYMGPAKAAV